jgi:hypothetical protein
VTTVRAQPTSMAVIVAAWKRGWNLAADLVEAPGEGAGRPARELAIVAAGQGTL